MQVIRFIPVLLIPFAIVALHHCGKLISHDQHSDEKRRKRTESIKPERRYSELIPVPPLKSLPESGKAKEKPPEALVGELFSGLTASGAKRKIRLFPIKCEGGPAHGRTHLLITSPEEMIQCGCGSVWVPCYAAYCPIPDPPANKKGPTMSPAYYFSYAGADARQMEISSMGLYVLEESARNYRLAFAGQVDLADYARFEKEVPQESKTTKPTPLSSITVSLRMQNAAVRHQKFFPMRLTGGPADGRVTLLPIEAEKLYKWGKQSVAVVEVSPRPRARAFVVGSVEHFDHVAHMSIYDIELTKNESLCGQFLYSISAEEYLKRHMSSLPKVKKD